MGKGLCPGNDFCDLFVSDPIAHHAHSRDAGDVQSQHVVHALDNNNAKPSNRVAIARLIEPPCLLAEQF